VSAPTASAPPITAPTTTVAPGPNSIDALIWMLAPNADAYGDRGSNLLDKLRDVQDERSKHPDSHEHVVDAADDLIDDVHKWLGEGRLNPTIGAHALRLLAPLAG
jgi:hypothetical protein